MSEHIYYYILFYFILFYEEINVKFVICKM